MTVWLWPPMYHAWSGVTHGWGSFTHDLAAQLVAGTQQVSHSSRGGAGDKSAIYILQSLGEVGEVGGGLIRGPGTLGGLPHT